MLEGAVFVMSENKIKHFDEKKFLVNFSGMEDLACETVDSFLQTSSELYGAIEKAIQLNDPKQIEITAHTLKGSVSNFYAQECYDKALKIEELGRDKKYSVVEIKSSLLLLKNELKNLEHDLKDFLNRRKSA